MLNRLDPNGGQPAQLSYLASDFKIVVPGTHVFCAVTGKPIPLDELRYWSFARQEAYIDAAASLDAEQRAQKG